MKTIPLGEIKYVLLDLDGTLLDKHFDDHFWEHLVPKTFAERNGMEFGAAKQYLMDKYRLHERTLNWTDLDFWSKELDLDIPALKEQIRHLIEVHPHVIEFLTEVRKRKMKVYLLTNAHHKSVTLKFDKTGIAGYFHSVITSNEIGYPKENIRFWQKAQQRLGFDSDKALFIDDNEDILHTAREFGIKHVLLKGRASSRQKPGKSTEFPCITDFNELLVQDPL